MATTCLTGKLFIDMLRSGAANLELHIMLLVQTEVVITLEQLIVEFNKGKPALKTLFVCLKRKHFVHTEA